MSDSEEEFASADEGDASVSKTNSADVKTKEKPSEMSDHKTQSVPSSATGGSARKSNGPKAGKQEDKQGAKPKGKNSKQKKKANRNKQDAKEEKKVNQKEEVKPEAISAEVDKMTLSECDNVVKKDDETVSSSASDRLKSPEKTKEPPGEGAQSQSQELKFTEKQEKEVDVPVESAVLDQTIDRDVASGADNSTSTDPVADTPEKQQSRSGWGGWSSWGTSIVSAASASVSTFTNQVGEGFTTVLETVETTLGAPSPEELIEREKLEAREDKSGDGNDESKEQQPSEASSASAKAKEGDGKSNNAGEGQATPTERESGAKGDNSTAGGGWLGGWGMSNLTHLVSDTGKTFVTGGLDVLEAIGKKTYDALSEHDPGLKAAIKGGNKPNLSSLLRDAKEQAEERSRMEAEYEESRQAQFGAMFDDFQGLVHLEALEMLSNQSENKVQALLATGSPESLGVLKGKLVQLKEVFELQELDDDEDEIEHDFPKLITDHLSEFHRGTSPAKLNAVQAKVCGWITNFSSTEGGSTSDPKEVHKVSIQALAELTAKTVEQFHKAGELLLLQSDQTDHSRDMLDRAKALASVTRVVCTEVGIMSSKFTKCLNKVAENLEDGESVNTFITNIYLEASNSSTYIQDAYQLLLPVVQQAMLEESSAGQS